MTVLFRSARWTLTLEECTAQDANPSIRRQVRNINLAWDVARQCGAEPRFVERLVYKTIAKDLAFRRLGLVSAKHSPSWGYEGEC